MAKLVLMALLLTAVGMQVWASSDMGATMAAQTAMHTDCAGQMDVGDDGADCCPDGAPMNAGCASLCSASAVIANISVQPAVGSGAAPLVLLPVPHSTPRYIPLTPPPNA
jgi:hypothetical protein